MRKSKAEMFRKSLHREDILKEPMTIYFKSIMTFVNSKNSDKQTAVDQQVVGDVQSQSNIISNIMLTHVEANKDKVAGQEEPDIPLISPFNQDEKHGFIADINSAIASNEG